jgi:hypothetical protein
MASAVPMKRRQKLRLQPLSFRRRPTTNDQTTDHYFGCSVCAIITCRLKSTAFSAVVLSAAKDLIYLGCKV